jgi:hypothetical protein
MIISVALHEKMIETAEKLVEDKSLGFEDLNDVIADALRNYPPFLRLVLKEGVID